MKLWKMILLPLLTTSSLIYANPDDVFFDNLRVNSPGFVIQTGLIPPGCNDMNALNQCYIAIPNNACPNNGIGIPDVASLFLNISTTTCVPKIGQKTAPSQWNINAAAWGGSGPPTMITDFAGHRMQGNGWLLTGSCTDSPSAAGALTDTLLFSGTYEVVCLPNNQDFSRMYW